MALAPHDGFVETSQKRELVLVVPASRWLAEYQAFLVLGDIRAGVTLAA